MKINGKKLTNNKDHRVGPFPIERTFIEDVDVLDDEGNPTGKTEKKEVQVVLGIYAKPIWSFKEFDELYPPPDAPVDGWQPKSGEKKKNFNDPQYLQDLDIYSQAREGWTIMKSIGEASGIELDGVDMKNPTTWPSILEKLRGGENGEDGLFSYFEYNEVIQLVDRAQGIDAAKLAENRESFLSQTQAAKDTTAPTKP